MNAESVCDHLSSLGSFLLPTLLDTAIKGVAILLLAALATLALRRASAATRHWVWFLGVLGLLILPILTAALPGWHILPRWTGNLAVPAPASVPAPSQTADRAGSLGPTAPDNQLSQDEQTAPAQSPAIPPVENSTSTPTPPPGQSPPP